MSRLSASHLARPLLIVLGVALVIATSRPARADHEGRIFAMALALPFLTFGGAALTAAPFLIASMAAADTVETRERPATGHMRLQALSPWTDARVTMLHLDFGGFPSGKHRLGWEGACQILALSNWSNGDLFVRWDGRGLWHTGRVDQPVALQLLSGLTVWPSFDRDLDIAWTGGVHSGMRVSASWGELGILRAQAEVVGVALVGAGATAIDTQIEVETSVSLHLPGVSAWRQTKGFGRQPIPGVGLAYRGVMPFESGSHVPRSHILLWNVVY